MHPGSVVVLEGVTGSRAYGMDTPESDTDLLGVFVAPTTAILGMNGVQGSVHTTNPDVTHHELGKYLALASKCNPTVLELLYLDSYTVVHPWGQRLIDVRSAFLATKSVMNAYGGYAMQQVRKLRDRSDGSFGADLRKRTAKHGRHCKRLLDQGYQLLATGTMTVRVADRDAIFAAGELAASDVDVFEATMAEGFRRLDSADSVLPDSPNLDLINDLLVDVRIRKLTQPDAI